MSFDDWVEYIVKYDRMYENGHIFNKHTFGSSNGRIVPIMFAESTPKISSKQEDNQCLGYAMLEERDDGMVAKCSFKDDSYGHYVKRILERGGLYSLTFQTPPSLSLDKTVEQGIITAVLVVQIWNAYQLKE